MRRKNISKRIRRWNSGGDPVLAQTREPVSESKHDQRKHDERCDNNKRKRGGCEVRALSSFLLSALLPIATAATTHAQTASDENEDCRVLKMPTVNEYDFSFWGRADRTYFIQTSTDLIHWQDVGVEWGADAVIGYGFTSTAPRFFLRLRHIAGQSGDVDGDDLADADEITAGTDPFNVDSDGDGWCDGLEVPLGTNPLNTASKPAAPVPPSPGSGALVEAGNDVELVYQPKVVYEVWDSQSGALNWYDLVEGLGGSTYGGSGPRSSGAINSLSYPPGDELESMPWLLEDYATELAAAAVTQHSGGHGDAWMMRSRVALRSAQAVQAPLHRAFLVVREVTDNATGAVTHQRTGWEQFTITPTHGAARYSPSVELTASDQPGKVTRVKLSPAYFERYAAGLGFDDTVWPPVQSVPLRETGPGARNYLRRVSLRVAPGLEEQFGIEVADTVVASVDVERSSELITVVITGETPGTTQIVARWLPDNEIAAVVGVDVLNKTTKTLAILEVAAQSTGLPPHNMPQKQEIQDFMTSTWGVQANVKLTATVDNCGSQPYDLSGDGYLNIHAPGTVILTPEENWLRNFAWDVEVMTSKSLRSGNSPAQRQGIILVTR
jgi:hypothetical protein